MSADEVITGIEAMADTFQRLGLLWRLVKGTVFNAATNTPTLTKVTLDSDSDATNAISMIGIVAPGTRVYVMVVPPQSNYIVGLVSAGSIINENGIGIGSATDTTTSATYVDMAATSSFTFTKGSTGTRLKVTMEIGSFITGVANTRPGFGVNIGGTDYDVVGMTINPLSTHTINAGFVYLPAGIAAGAYTVQGRWKRISGTGTLNRNTEDPISISVLELP